MVWYGADGTLVAVESPSAPKQAMEKYIAIDDVDSTTVSHIHAYTEVRHSYNKRRAEFCTVVEWV